jgi:SnoaL-like polyketide cyclase
MFRQAFPDGRMTIENMVAEGDRVATRKTFRGTHRGELMGIPPTGKVVETWHVGDDLGVLQQLGALQPPSRPIDEAARLTWWAVRESNSRPPRCKRRGATPPALVNGIAFGYGT